MYFNVNLKLLIKLINSAFFLCLNYVAATCFSRSRSSSGTCCNKTLLYVTNIISCDKKAVDVERDEATLNGG